MEHYGEPIRASIALSRSARAKFGDADQARHMEDQKSLKQALTEGRRRGVSPGAHAVAGLVARHRAGVVQMLGKECPPAAYEGLADMYLAHPDFRSRYEAIAPGFTDWLAAAIKAHSAA